MDEFFSISGAQTTFNAAVAAMARKDYVMVDRLVMGLAESSAQGDFDVVYGAVFAAHLDRK